MLKSKLKLKWRVVKLEMWDGHPEKIYWLMNFCVREYSNWPLVLSPLPMRTVREPRPPATEDTGAAGAELGSDRPDR